MSNLADGFGAVVTGAMSGAKAQLQAERQNYLKFMADREKAGAQPEESFAELETLIDRGQMDPEEQYLDTLNVTAKYTHVTGTKIGANGTVGVAIGPANVSLGGSYEGTQQDESDLTIGAVYKTRSKTAYMDEMFKMLQYAPPQLAPNTGANTNVTVTATTKAAGT